MPATVLVAPHERATLGFALARVCSFYAKGTTEQREAAVSLAQMLRGLQSAPPGAIEMDFLTQDAYLLGVRLFFTSVELEEYWLDARAVAEGSAAADFDPSLVAAARQYFPELVSDPLSWSAEPTRAVYTDLGFKIDRAVTEAAPRSRGIYNSDREEMSDRAVAIREERARERAAVAQAAVPVAAGGVAVAERPVAPVQDWGVDVTTGLTPDDIPVNSFRPLTVGSVRLLITNYDGQLRAVSGNCTHQQAALAKGRVEGSTLECPRHGATFDLKTGTQICPPFCQRWMDRHGFLGSLMALVTPDKEGGDLPGFPLRVENGEIILRV